MIENVAIVGGTHGNEITGVYLVKKWQQQPQLIQRQSFSAQAYLANNAAIAECRRYLDHDLNRQFSRDALADPSLTSAEQKLAKELNQKLGPKGEAKTDLIIDLHTTTSNMGPTVLLPSQGRFYRRMAAYIKRVMPDVTLFRDEDHKSNDEHHLLCTVGKYGVIVEVGPVPQGSLRQDVFETSEMLTQVILDFVQAWNDDNLSDLPKEVEAFRFLESLKLPLDENGERVGMVHASLQDNDFKPLRTGDPLFQTFDGETIYYQKHRTVYPAFINEAAYYDNNLAMSLLERVTIEVD